MGNCHGAPESADVAVTPDLFKTVPGLDGELDLMECTVSTVDSTPQATTPNVESAQETPQSDESSQETPQSEESTQPTARSDESTEATTPKEDDSPVAAMRELLKQKVGAYLLYDSRDRGKLLLSWSKTPVEGALAVSFPPTGVIVPAYKLKGKEQVCRNIQNMRDNYFAGWISYIKAVRQYSGRVQLLPHPPKEKINFPPVKLVFHFPDNSVSIISSANPDHEPFWTETADAVAAHPSHCNAFDGVQFMADHVFFQKGRLIEAGDAQTL